MEVCLICLTHEKTPQEFLNKLYQYYINKEEEVQAYFEEGAKAGAYLDWVLLATPHRFELYALSSVPIKAKEYYEQLINRILKSPMAKYSEFYESKEIMKHLACVAAGTKSKIIGERDILHQVSRAYSDARPHCNVSRKLGLIFERAIMMAIKFRNRTSIEQGYKSYADIPLEIITHLYPKFDKTFLIFGTEIMGSYLLRKLRANGAKSIYVCSSVFENAKAMAERFNVEPVDIKSAEKVFSEADIFLFCMAGGPFVDLNKLLPKIKQKTLVMDLGVPPNVSDALKMIGATYYCMADFDKFAEKDSKPRKEISAQIMQSISAEIDSTYDGLLKYSSDVPLKLASKSAVSPEISMEVIMAYALENAVAHEGIAKMDSVINKLFQQGLQKDKLPKVVPIVKLVLSEIGKMSIEQQKSKFEGLKHLLPGKSQQKIRGELPELPNVHDKVITRIAPEPSKYTHIGHALVFLIQYFYAQKYNGSCILRMEDTNPEKSRMQYYDAMIEDLKWIGIKWDKELIVSEDMPLFYDSAKKMIMAGDAYTCSCSAESIKAMRSEEVPCPCRQKDIQSNLHEWQMMLEGKFKEGERTLRLKGDVSNQNATLRDPVLFRLFDSPHFLCGNKYHAWPMYDFENPIEDSLCKITHVIRTKEFELREELHKYILYLLGMDGPTVKEIARYNIEGASTQGRVIREMIEKNEISGWDDPRLVTIKALRRRGFVPEMLQELAMTVGLSKSSGKIDTSLIESINKKIIDPVAKRYFFVEEPVKIKINGSKESEADVPLHPSDPSFGNRHFRIKSEFFITNQDLKEIEESNGKPFRLMHLFNFAFKENSFRFISSGLDKSLNAKLIHWLPASENNVKTEILMPNGTLKRGLAESSARDLNVGDIIQFERFGFCRLDEKSDEKMVFWYAHK